MSCALFFDFSFFINFMYHFKYTKRKEYHAISLTSPSSFSFFFGRACAPFRRALLGVVFCLVSRPPLKEHGLV